MTQVIKKDKERQASTRFGSKNGSAKAVHVHMDEGWEHEQRAVEQSAGGEVGRCGRRGQRDKVSLQAMPKGSHDSAFSFLFFQR